MAYTIFKDFSFAAAHSIPDHPGKCRNLHGHNYRVRVHLRAETLDRLGMVLDFSRLKEVMRLVIDPLDHQLLNEIPPFDERNSTAELLSEYICLEVSRHLADDPEAKGRVSVARVELWETDSSCAIYEP